jgi:hypothetical protein
LKEHENSWLTVFERNRGGVTGVWKKLHNEELYHVIRLSTSRRMIWVGHVASRGEMKKAYRILVVVGGKIILKRIINTRTVSKVRGLTLLLRVGTLWRCGDGLFFEVPPLASDALVTTLHPLLENVLQTVDHFEISSLAAFFSGLEKPRNRMGRDLN